MFWQLLLTSFLTYTVFIPQRTAATSNDDLSDALVRRLEGKYSRDGTISKNDFISLGNRMRSLHHDGSLLCNISSGDLKDCNLTTEVQNDFI